MSQLTFDELQALVSGNEARAEAEPNDPRVEEWTLIAELASELIEYREIYGALKERGFLTR